MCNHCTSDTADTFADTLYQIDPVAYVRYIIQHGWVDPAELAVGLAELTSPASLHSKLRAMAMLPEYFE